MSRPDGVDVLRELADQLEEERVKVGALLLAVRNARAASVSKFSPGGGWEEIRPEHWRAICKALDAIEKED